ncbi:putative selection and upkeep of intraepithelial T-cells protein 1 homolog isoform X2 [Nycticebus coucang]|uniref:putative selection and upkeep of intraepithelial T-cells protein 1 homolog isoform X2 n=1 Tax=Nycticebus coucang TaxID=9470 RepID=UPI00234E1473|nr:putative selection and upkeep of intraepithelial T-cells protein 1 homolog isoform X2 [Nycticebus coucang]
MKVISCSLSGYLVTILLQITALTSAQFVVHGTVKPVVATPGEQVDLHCQLSPPQNASLMEVRWFRDRYTQPVYLYQGGKDMYIEIIKEYVERTEFLKQSIEEGKVTLRIYNISPSDAAKYHCFFKNSDFYEEAIMDLKVAALGLEIQIQVNNTDRKEIMLTCKSGGWFPKPQIQWTDSNRQKIPLSSESYSQDESKLFHITTTVNLTDSSKESVTCHFLNPVTGQEKWTSIELSDTLFPEETWFSIFLIIISMLLLINYVSWFYLSRPWNSYKMFVLMIMGIVTFMVTNVTYLSFIMKGPDFPSSKVIREACYVVGFAMAMFVTMVISFLYLLLRGRELSLQDQEGETTHQE